MLCISCRERPTLARGLCQRCYYRMRRTGSVQRTNAQNLGRICLVDGCDKPAMAKGLCLHHYEHQRHPLSHTWRSVRSKHPGEFPPEWERFDAFLADVGERPGPAHQLRRIDADKPWSRGNAHWLAPVNPGRDYMTKEQRSAYQREWHINRKFNITGEEYAALLNAQGGGCAICGQKETHTSRNGKLKDLAVDHDHVTGTVRGLLCFNCNQGIGRLQNSPQLMRRAADYIDRHANPLGHNVVPLKGA